MSSSNPDDFDPFAGKVSDSPKPKRSMLKTVVIIAVAVVGGLFALGFAMAGFSDSLYGSYNPVVANELSQEEKATIAQNNAAGGTVLYQCTSELPRGSADCDSAITTMAEICTTAEERNYFDFCKDPRLANYLNAKGGYDSLVQQIADRDKANAEVRAHIMDDFKNRTAYTGGK